tara:strand:- start:44 stop:865 length:822 start_codon:yes stop_codon:yes gene_type:complete
MNEQARKKRIIFIALLFLIALVGAWWWIQQQSLELVDTVWTSGWVLLASIFLPSIFNLRKRLAAFNVGKASTWYAIHVVSGFAAIFFYILHAGVKIPTGAYEILLFTLFALVSVTGIVGYVVQAILPRRMTETGEEIVYEKIPEEIYEIRNSAKSAMLAYTESSGSDLLSKHYDSALRWFFEQPRFYFNHVLGGAKAPAWVRSQFEAIRRFAAPDSMEYVDEIEKLALHKLNVDTHFACQDVMKRWLLIHLPLAVAFLVTVVWHIILVHVYAS